MNITIAQSADLKTAIIEALATNISLKLFLGIFCALFIKMLATTILNYLMIRWSFLGERTPIVYKDKVGYLNKLYFTNVEIIIKEDGNRVHIPLGKFLTMDKEIPKN